MNTEMLSFHGKQEIKDKYLGRLEIHQRADEIIQGTGWENGKGCAVGCTLHAYDHSRYETELGIPHIIARLEDRIFEGLPNAEAKTFPAEFLTSIPVGKNLDAVWKLFLVWLLIDEKEGVIQYAKTDNLREIITKIADLIKRSISEDISDFRDDLLELRKRAYAAYAAAAAAAAAAAYAYAAAAADAADAAAAAAAAAAADAAYAAAKQQKYRAMRVKLIQLLKEA